MYRHTIELWEFIWFLFLILVYQRKGKFTINGDRGDGDGPCYFCPWLCFFGGPSVSVIWNMAADVPAYVVDGVFLFFFLFDGWFCGLSDMPIGRLWWLERGREGDTYM